MKKAYARYVSPPSRDLARSSFARGRVKEDANSLGPKVSSADRSKLDEYLTSVRQVEKRVWF